MQGKMAISDKSVKKLKELGLEEVITKLNEIEAQRDFVLKAGKKADEAEKKAKETDKKFDEMRDTLSKQPLTYWWKSAEAMAGAVLDKIFGEAVSSQKKTMEETRKQAKQAALDLMLECDKLSAQNTEIAAKRRKILDDVANSAYAFLKELDHKKDKALAQIESTHQKVLLGLDEKTIMGRIYTSLTKRAVVFGISLASVAALLGLTGLNFYVLQQVRKHEIGAVSDRVRSLESYRGNQMRDAGELEKTLKKTAESIKKSDETLTKLTESNKTMASDFDTFKKDYDKLSADTKRQLDDYFENSARDAEVLERELTATADAAAADAKTKTDQFVADSTDLIAKQKKDLDKTLADNDLKYTKAFADIAAMTQKADALQKAYDANQAASKAEKAVMAKHSEELASALVSMLETNSKLISSDIEAAEKLSRESIEYMKTAAAKNPETEKYSKQLNALKSSQESLESAYSAYKKQVVQKLDALGELAGKEHTQKELTNLTKQITEGMVGSRKPVEEYEAKTKPLLEELAKAAKSDEKLQRDYALIKQQSEDIAKKHKALYETSETRYKGTVLLIKQKEIK